MSVSASKKIDQKIQDLYKQIQSLEKSKEVVTSRKLITCSRCKKASILSKWIVLVDHHYIRPSGCTDGDYWVMSNEYHLICPKCDNLTRTYRSTHYSGGEHYEYSPNENLYVLVDKNKELFAECFDVYIENWYDRKHIDLDDLRKAKKEKEDRGFDW